MRSVHVADLDGDGGLDVVAAVYYDDTVDWYRNPAWASFDSDADGLTSGVESCITGTDPQLTDTDGGGTDDGTEVAEMSDPFDPADD